MNLRKLFLVAFAGLSLQTMRGTNTQVAQEQLQLESQALVTQEEIKKEINNIYLQIQKECSKQIDLLTAIVQQIIGGIQKGIIRSSVDKNEILKKISAYGSISHQLQSMSVLTAEPETLVQITIILKNIIDRLTLAVDSDLALLDVPNIEDLLIPDKNFTDSFDYILNVLNKNDERLIELEKNSTSLGLTSLNKAVRATEDFVKTYKLPIMGACAVAGLYMGYTLLNMPLITVTKTIIDPKTEKKLIFPESKNAFTLLYELQESTAFYTAFGGTALALIARDAFDASVGTVSKAFFQRNANWLFKKYEQGNSLLSDYYDSLKGIKNIRRDGLATILENIPTLNDECFIGLEYQINQFKIILDYLDDPELYLRADNEIPKAWLLIGPSRTGKTAAAKALAATINQRYDHQGNKTKIKFIEVDYTLITNLASLRTYIDHAIQNAPCILFIDEIHLLGLQKTGNKELLNEFLTQLTELHRIKDPSKQVFILAATNHPELLAPELFKHERFGKVIRFKKPGIKERAQFFATNFDKYGINPQTVDLKSIVLQTKDCDYGHLQQIVKDARFEARANGQGVSQAHLQRAINSIVHGIGSTAELTKDEAEIAAVDQAGKIVAHKKLEIHETIHLATISKVDGRIEEDHFWLSEKKDTEVIPMRYGAIISTSNREEIPFSNAQEIEKLCKRYLAGICAQRIILGNYHIDYTAQDYKAAFEWAQKLILKGLMLKSLPPEQQNRVFEETEKLLQRFEAEVLVLLQEHKPLIEKLVEELLKERCITGKEIDNIVQ